GHQYDRCRGRRPSVPRLDRRTENRERLRVQRRPGYRFPRAARGGRAGREAGDRGSHRAVAARDQSARALDGRPVRARRRRSIPRRASSQRDSGTGGADRSLIRSFRLSASVVERLPAIDFALPEDEYADHADDEAGDVRGKGDAAAPMTGRRGRDLTDAADQLQQEPEREQDDGRQLDYFPENDPGDERQHARVRIQHEVRAHHASDCAARADRRQRRRRIDRDLSDRRRDPAEQIEDDEASVAEAIFDVVAENPEVPHVPDDVHPAAVEEHRRDERRRGEVGRRSRSEEHTSELQSLAYLVCRLLLEKKTYYSLPPMGSPT